MKTTIYQAGATIVNTRNFLLGTSDNLPNVIDFTSSDFHAVNFVVTRDMSKELYAAGFNDYNYLYLSIKCFNHEYDLADFEALGEDILVPLNIHVIFTYEDGFLSKDFYLEDFAGTTIIPIAEYASGRDINDISISIRQEDNPDVECVNLFYDIIELSSKVNDFCYY